MPLARRALLRRLGAAAVAAVLPTFAPAANAPALMLAGVYRPGVALEAYWLSEKYDGLRARWDGQRLLTRGGESIAAPVWFTAGWPAVPLDGELWAGRGRFEEALSTVRRQTPDEAAWRRIRFMVFDLPAHQGPFNERIAAVQHQAFAPIRHHAVQPRHEGCMGALVVETPAGVRFRLGTGFTDAQRERPPAVGEWVTYRFRGLSAAGVPRFASFMRLRPDAPAR
ncbi:MAG: DNA ligase [Rubrivivax sp.]|nr:MAG: DNA ligase [Rubrivivax sp.]